MCVLEKYHFFKFERNYYRNMTYAISLMLTMTPLTLMKWGINCQNYMQSPFFSSPNVTKTVLSMSLLFTQCASNRIIKKVKSFPVNFRPTRIALALSASFQSMFVGVPTGNPPDNLLLPTGRLLSPSRYLWAYTFYAQVSLFSCACCLGAGPFFVLGVLGSAPPESPFGFQGAPLKKRRFPLLYHLLPLIGKLRAK